MNSTEVKECFRKAFEEANYLLWNEAFFKFVKANYDLPIKQNNSLYRFAAMELNKELDGNRKDYFTEDSFKEMICYDIVEEGDDKMKDYLRFVVKWDIEKIVRSEKSKGITDLIEFGKLL